MARGFGGLYVKRDLIGVQPSRCNPAPPSRDPKPVKDIWQPRRARPHEHYWQPRHETRYGEGWQTRDKSSAAEECFLMAETRAPGPAGYSKLLGDLKQRIQAAQLHASLAVNRELVFLYWQIGRDILARQERESWGTKVIDRLAGDLKAAFPEMKGFSPRNLKYMRAFAEAWPEEAIVQQLVAQIPWGHNVRILDYLKDPVERKWYVRATVQHGWSRDVLVHQIESGLFRRQGKAVTNFEQALPLPQSDLAQQITKDPYNFDFLLLGPEAHERDL
jgi:predicted nuclease of restriction endonuclease-like (RecB) superfamily